MLRFSSVIFPIFIILCLAFIGYVAFVYVQDIKDSDSQIAESSKTSSLDSSLPVETENEEDQDNEASAVDPALNDSETKEPQNYTEADQSMAEAVKARLIQEGSAQNQDSNATPDFTPNITFIKYDKYASKISLAVSFENHLDKVSTCALTLSSNDLSVFGQADPYTQPLNNSAGCRFNVDTSRLSPPSKTANWQLTVTLKDKFKKELGKTVQIIHLAKRVSS